jgi:hypothetical protein
VFDFSEVPSPGIGVFARMPTYGTADATFRNFADHNTFIRVSSGSTAPHQAGLILTDRGNDKWSLAKLANADNKLNLFNFDNSASAILWETTSASTIDSVFSTRIMPVTDNVYDIGSATREFKDIYVQNPVTVSDERQKIEIADSDLGLDFVKALRAVKYKMSVAERFVTELGADGLPVATETRAGERFHYGLIAQEVREAIPQNGDFAGWVLSDKNDPQSRQALRYQQFIAPIIKAIQQLDARVEQLETA